MSRNTKSAIIYLFMTVFAFIVDRVYSLFSHGVSSGDMSFMWLFLLCSGTVFYLALTLLYSKTKRQPRRFALNIYNSGTAIFVTGMLLHGIFEIAGTSSVFTLYYKIAGSAFMAVGFILILFLRGEHHSNS